MTNSAANRELTMSAIRLFQNYIAYEKHFNPNQYKSSPLVRKLQEHICVLIKQYEAMAKTRTKKAGKKKTKKVRRKVRRKVKSKK